MRVTRVESAGWESDAVLANALASVGEGLDAEARPVSATDATNSAKDGSNTKRKRTS
jgi:hypothetical protein